MEYHLEQFYESDSIRHFVFGCVRPDRSTATVIVRADTKVARKYEIRLQELPVLCRRLLDALPEGSFQPIITLTEEQMIVIQRTARAAAEKKPHRPPRPSQAAGQAWRNPQV